MDLLLASPKYWLAVSGIVISGIVFFIYARSIASKQLSIDNFLISDKELSGDAYSNTFASSTLSLGSTIIFFIEAHKHYGWLMAIGPMFLIAVQFILLRITHAISLDFNKTRTVADLWFSVFPSKTIAKNITFMTVATSILSMCFEIFIGSEILAFFLPNTPLYQSAAFFFICVLVLGYVYYGGYRAIVKTDKWQLTLIILATVAFVFFAITAPIINDNLAKQDIFLNLFSFQEKGSSLVVFLLWACAINFCVGFSDICTWQRMSASRNLMESYLQLGKGIWKFLFIFFFPMMCFIAIGVKGYQYSSLSDFLTIVFNQSGFAGYIVFPLIVTGLAAALFSTADTFMISAIYGVCDHNTFLPKLKQLDENKRDALMRKYLSRFALGLFVLLTAFYYIQHHKIAEYLMPIFYAVWGQVAIIAPLAIYALYRRYNNMPVINVNSASNTVLLASLYLGWSIILIGSIAGGHILPQLNLLLGLLIINLGIAGTLYISQEKKLFNRLNKKSFKIILS